MSKRINRKKTILSGILLGLWSIGITYECAFFFPLLLVPQWVTLAIYYIIPIVSGLLCFLFYRSDHLWPFFKRAMLSILISLVLIVAVTLIGIPFTAYTLFTGYEEASPWAGLFLLICLWQHVKGIAIGTLLAGAVSLYKQLKKKKEEKAKKFDKKALLSGVLFCAIPTLTE